MPTKRREAAAAGAQPLVEEQAAPQPAQPVLVGLVATVYLAGAVILFGGFAMLADVVWPAIICLALLAALAERFDWSMYGNSRVSVAIAPILASAALFGVAGVAVVVPVAIAAGYVGSGRSLLKTAFNLGALAVTGASSVLVFDAFGSAGEADAWPQVVVPALLASAVSFCVNTGLVAGAISLENRTALAKVWKEHFVWLWPHYVVLGLVGVSIAGAYVAFGLSGFAVFLLPPLMMRLSLKQYVDRTAASMEELRVVNEELSRRNNQLLDARAQAATDSLTGLRNHRAFQERIRDELARAQAGSTHIGLIMLDVDGFKQLNDSLGHLAGDKMLRGLASALTDVVKRRDVYRYGGDEFAVLLPGQDVRTTAEIGEQLRLAVETRIDSGGSTISVGVAAFPEMAQTAEELIYTADMAMYWAKSTGKNRVGRLQALHKSGNDAASAWHIAEPFQKPPEAIAAFAALEAREGTPSSHSERCFWYATRVAEEMGLNEDDRQLVGLAALLHDVGNLAVPDSVLSKAGRLSKKERAQIRQHSAASLRVLGHIPSVAAAAPAILHHHEHFDGSGYPDGLRGNDIPITSRVLLVADAFDAMTTDRPYRKAFSVKDAIKELERNSGGQFDPVVVQAFLRILDRTQWAQ